MRTLTLANSEKAMKDPELAKSAKSLAAHQERLLQGHPWNTMKALHGCPVHPSTRHEDPHLANSETAMKDPELAKSAKSLAAHQERLLQGQPWNTMKALVRLSSAPKHSQGGAWHSAQNVAYTDAEHKLAMCKQVCTIPMKVS